jgi:hypothetical protein
MRGATEVCALSLETGNQRKSLRPIHAGSARDSGFQMAFATMMRRYLRCPLSCEHAEIVAECDVEGCHWRRTSVT